MLWPDFLRLAIRAITAHRLRSALTLLGIAVGIAAVILLTSIGEGVHQFVLAQFTQFGTNVIELTPGKVSTGGAPQGLPSSARPITQEDVAALARLPGVSGVTPIVWGNSEVEAEGRLRRSMVYGVGANMAEVFRMAVRSGRFLPQDDAAAARAFVVLGSKLKQELFGSRNPLGARVRIAGQHFRVIGVMESKGQFVGMDLDDTAYIPASQALALYNRDGMMKVDLTYREGTPSALIAGRVSELLKARHGREDFTLTTQEDMLRTLGKILDVLTAAVAAIGSISLLVGGVGIVTIMSIAVAERTQEIGLLVALGATRRSILALFLGEAVMLSAAGGVIGLAAGIGVARLLQLAAPAMPVHTPLLYVLLAEGIAIGIGLIAGVWPARRAARLDPVEALRAE
ncbi:ABC transporter permease [Uliginosibacterium aquaticum]|uniref:ABC transporter permease n=1 Tax=Uliginosibacterium aquaticum TaxID=2731212 RepID=A0ABX2IHK1_9RHOO|nr:ABC transporter permease [Uliginosibacterium aquaticum]NSL56225.1 ABC transporter permease [Uliginosibacterium aquaticum]